MKNIFFKKKKMGILPRSLRVLSCVLFAVRTHLKSVTCRSKHMMSVESRWLEPTGLQLSRDWLSI